MNDKHHKKNNSDSNHIQFVFFGRLDQEKGWDLLINVWQRLVNEYKEGHNDYITKTRFLVFGDGPYREKLLHLGAKSSSIKYFGWKARSDLERYIAASDYTLMPSLFLETFGLTALESLSLGVPVIGFKKGWLIPFITPELNINNYPGDNDEEKLYNCLIEAITNTPLKQKQRLCERASKTSYKYTKEHWLKNFHQLIHTNDKQRRVLLVSDYATELYGIETHIYSLKAMLEKNGYEVELYGANVRKNKRNKLVRTLLLPISTRNFRAARQIKNHIGNSRPHIIRWHSTSRWLGRYPLWATRNFKGQQWMTYHDLWYFHPFPHKVHETKQLPTWKLGNYLKAGKTKNPIVLLAMICKFILHGFLRKQVKKNLDKHFVPSTYMFPIVQKRLGHKPKGKVMLLEHYLRDT